MAVERVVTIGSYASGVILVNNGLEAGDVVITDGVQLVRPGQKVKAISTQNGESQ